MNSKSKKFWDNKINNILLNEKNILHRKTLESHLKILKIVKKH